MAAQAYTPEIDPEDPPRGRQRLLQATTLTGREGAPVKGSSGQDRTRLISSVDLCIWQGQDYSNYV